MTSPCLTLFFPFWLAAALIACESTSAIHPNPVSEEQLVALRVEVRRIIRGGCGSCHTTGLRTAKPAALAVFDLAQDNWSAPMTKAELHGLQRRTKDIRDTLAAKVEALVAAELALRPPATESETGGKD